MKSLDEAFNKQRQLLKSFADVAAYKLGGTNKFTKGIFGVDHLLLGGLPSTRVFNGSTARVSGRCELELVARVRVSGSSFKVDKWFLGLEFPDFTATIEPNSAYSAILNNLSSGYLQLLSEDEGLSQGLQAYEVSLDGVPVEITNHTKNLIATPQKLVEQALSLLAECQYPASDGLLVATGGLGALFEVKKGQSVICEILS